LLTGSRPAIGGGAGGFSTAAINRKRKALVSLGSTMPIGRSSRKIACRSGSYPP
jgi:hypothetical protein